MRALVMGLVFVLCGSCASMGGRTARRAAPELVEGSLLAMEDAQNRRLLRELLLSPEVNEGAEVLGGSLAKGALAELLAGENRAGLEALVRELSRAAAQGAFDEVENEWSPARQEAVENTVREILAGAAQELAGGFADALVSQRQQQGGEPVTELVQRLLSRGVQLTSLGLVALVLVVAAILWRTLRRRRHRPPPEPALTPELLAALVARAVKEALAEERSHPRPPEPPEERAPPTH